MYRFSGLVLPGDVVVLRTHDLGGYLIRLGAALTRKPAYNNHVIIASHTDLRGTFWGIEGRPGGVGWVDLGHVVTHKDRWMIANNAQPKTWAQRRRVIELARALLGVPYDWPAIAAHALEAIWGNPVLPSGGSWVQRRPGAVVCSSFADWIYEQVGLASPGPDSRTRLTSPADWDRFISREGWK